MMYRTATAQIFTNIGAFRGFCHGNPVSLERVQSGDFGIEKARKCPAVEHLRTFFRWQGQKDLNPRHAVLEAMLKFISRSGFSPILEICCQPRRWWLKNWCFFDDMLNSAPDFWCSWWWIWIPRFGLNNASNQILESLFPFNGIIIQAKRTSARFDNKAVFVSQALSKWPVNH